MIACWLAVLLLLSATPDCAGSRPSMIEQWLRQHDLQIQVRGSALPPSADLIERVLQEVAVYNREAQLEGLAEDLNPALLDPEKVKIFLQRLPLEAPDPGPRLRGKVLYLRAAKLGLRWVDPIDVAQLQRGFHITFPDPGASPYIHPVLQAPIDSARARELANRARAACKQYDEQVRKSQAEVDATPKSDPGYRLRFAALMAARRKRFATAGAWATAANALAAASPGDHELREDALRAGQAVQDYTLLPGGMPPLPH